ncbi:MAG: FecR domain-containing protein, partial [Paucibacter sp.]|nr:FecR domain-containing protein [Roseateles sp.]
MTPEIAAEAAVWVARLHGPDRSVHMERECLAWQARSAAHRLAFERCTDTWQDVAGLRLSTYANAASAGAASDAKRAGPFKPRRWALAATALAVGGVLVLQPWRAVDSYVTGVGELRTVILQDGTRMSLNTATRVRVELARAQRSVKVEGGEALFEVAKDARRPFVVQAAGTEVVAMGTAFVV